MKFHHDKHHQAYGNVLFHDVGSHLFDTRSPASVTNVNKALEGKPVVSLLELQKGAIKAGPAIRNNGGGHCEDLLPLSFSSAFSSTITRSP